MLNFRQQISPLPVLWSVYTAINHSLLLFSIFLDTRGHQGLTRLEVEQSMISVRHSPNSLSIYTNIAMEANISYFG